MGDETRLKDAKIEVKLDTAGALKALGDLENASGGKSKPGGRPPSPGRKDERREREDEGRKRKGGGIGVVGVGAAAAGVAGIPGFIVGVVKTLVAATVATSVSEVVPGMIAERMRTTDDGSTGNNVAKFLQDTVGLSLDKFVAFIHTVESMAGLLPAFLGTATEISTTSKALFGEAAPIEGVFATAKTQAAVAGAMAMTSVEQRRMRRFILGTTMVEGYDQLIAMLFESTNANR